MCIASVENKVKLFIAWVRVVMHKCFRNNCVNVLKIKSNLFLHGMSLQNTAGLVL